jgi:hypothetical protein
MVKGVGLFYIGGFDIRDNALDLQLKFLRSFCAPLNVQAKGARRIFAVSLLSDLLGFSSFSGIF